MKNSLIAATKLEPLVRKLKGWKAARGKLCKEYKSKDFRQAFGFMTELALLSERMNHHPDWANLYSKVHIALWTHELGGISYRDIEWAKSAESVFNRNKK